MTTECKLRILNYLEVTKNDPAKVMIANGRDSMTEILQLAYSCFVEPRERSCLSGDEFREIIREAAGICRGVNVPIIRGEFITDSMTNKKKLDVD